MSAAQNLREIIARCDAEIARLKEKKMPNEEKPAGNPKSGTGAAPRRCYIDKMTSEEKTLLDAIGMLEELPAHPLLSEAQTLVQQARDKVADYVDQLPEPEVSSKDMGHPLFIALHTLWTKAVGTPFYIKSEWRAFEALIKAAVVAEASFAPTPRASTPRPHLPRAAPAISAEVDKLLADLAASLCVPPNALESRNLFERIRVARSR
jgi:hypothetical protein